MRFLVVLLCALAIAGCRRGEAPEPTVDFVETATTGTTATSGTITPGTTERATTNTATIAPVAPTRTTTDAAPSPTAEIIDGRPIFEKQCAKCHGAAGERMHGDRRSLRTAAVQQMSEAQIASAIRQRPVHEGLQLPDNQLNTVAAYVKALD